MLFFSEYFFGKINHGKKDISVDCVAIWFVTKKYFFPLKLRKYYWSRDIYENMKTLRTLKVEGPKGIIFEKIRVVPSKRKKSLSNMNLMLWPPTRNFTFFKLLSNLFVLHSLAFISKTCISNAKLPCYSGNIDPMGLKRVTIDRAPLAMSYFEKAFDVYRHGWALNRK